MAHENIKNVERLLDLENGCSIWKVHVDACREQDKNAQVMPLEKFERLTANIAKDNRLESLPLVTPIINQGGNPEFLIISGHHRIRAARSAGMEFVHVLSLDEELTPDQIRAKQLSHNSLVGFSDPVLLAEMYSEIGDINAKLESGIFDIDLKVEMPSIPAGDIKLNFDYELIQFYFLQRQRERFDDVAELVVKDAHVYLADKDDFERMKNIMIKISENENIRNTSAIMVKIVDIVEGYYNDKKII